ncbi:hypothetical protein EF847_16710 [Actinobacteria bacterium YIM 96077]|uniref:GNAT family N-acetyltransferase n=1 Tax=Phytoactinopolyspora halophila TaxID=1981511 RepID=A0A329QI52_9ACTN|nr:hypothetical protein [Phytoactinopolyspora halophila]AYY14095.1 hypothetical protein EF847_16710 [Actinobacteria bacterium YIM 96077]RAW11002.1 hypothetical protein DPM12_18045 [Phytoactinopolyspora halophila]
MEHTIYAASPHRPSPALDHDDQLFGFRDRASGARMGFYRPCDRYDLWQQYVVGATRTYRRFGAENALTLPTTTPESITPIFAVAHDNNDDVVAGWYANGPLDAVYEAHAPSEFQADPLAATLVAEWISQALPDGAIELKAGWVGHHAHNKGALADLVARSFVHALRFLRVRYAFGTVAQHAGPRWCGAGARPVDGIPATPYPDERYLTSFYQWDLHTAHARSAPEQQQLFLSDIEMGSPTMTSGVRQ